MIIICTEAFLTWQLHVAMTAYYLNEENIQHIFHINQNEALLILWNKRNMNRQCFDTRYWNSERQGYHFLRV